MCVHVCVWRWGRGEVPSRLNLELYIAKFFTITMCSFSSPWEPSNHDVNLYGRREKERERIRHTERKKDIPLEINKFSKWHSHQTMYDFMDPIESPSRCRVGMPRDGNGVWWTFYSKNPEKCINVFTKISSSIFNMHKVSYVPNLYIRMTSKRLWHWRLCHDLFYIWLFNFCIFLTTINKDILP